MTVSRRGRLVISVLAVLCLTVAVWQVPRICPRQQPTEQLGRVQVYPSWWWQRGLVFVFSAANWASTDAAVARSFASRGYRVVGVDTTEALATLHANGSCLYLPSILENFSRDEQRKTG